MTRVSDGAARVQVVVENREITHVPGEADGELAGGIVITEQDIGQGITALFRRVKLLDKGGSRIRNPSVGDWLSAREHNNCWYASLCNSFDERALSANQREIIGINVFTSSISKSEPYRGLSHPKFTLVAGFRPKWFPLT